ncbi:radical SAM protein [Candidatus Endobugula sertula]|uniref:Radical SAM protein n=1 Tax=Candidatus Endobugula sertula TaxID=62101 RepID=A0A1D2QNF1_9GAMM|nr:radical SAM protein [Candidatus Endobugula sertula]
MKILKVIHGYPMWYNAGSEVYSQTLCQELASRHEVHVFTREENAFSPDFSMRQQHDVDDSRITLHIVNNPRLQLNYQVDNIDQRFEEVLDNVQPDVVHVGHLSHLSTSLLVKATLREIPIIFTLHDYWLMCPRGQFIQTFPENPNDLWAVCHKQEDSECAKRCYAPKHSGVSDGNLVDVNYWTEWVRRRMQHIREMVALVDVFIAPSRYLYRRYRDEFGIPERNLYYLDYGFSHNRVSGRKRFASEYFVFGYIGRHIPAKGIQDLIYAFSEVGGKTILRIWGRSCGQDTKALKSIVSTLPVGVAERIEWMPEYRNDAIVQDVFDCCDAIVVPSIWVENSPLVIHEAQQTRLPVITADIGGMKEYVRHEVNGLLFEHRSIPSLTLQMQRFVDEPEFAASLGKNGYLYSDTGDIPDIGSHAIQIENVYHKVLKQCESVRVKRNNGPWRITFDTNPDHCNLHCTMCEDHSPYSTTQAQRKAAGKPRRMMPFEMIEKVIADAVPHGLKEIIPSTMGEPLLYKQFTGILDLCKKYNIKLNLTTNGTFPGIGARAWAKLIVPVASDVKISWNGATKKTHEIIMLGSHWENTLENARTFIAVRDAHAAKGGNRCSVTFQLTFLEDSFNELADVVKLAIRLGVDRVKGHHLWTHFTEIEDQSMRRNAEAIQRWNEAVRNALAVAAEFTLPNGRHITLDNIFELDEGATEDLSPGDPCPFLGQEAWVSATGRFDPCCAPDTERRTLGEFGDLHKQDFMEIWNGDTYKELLANYYKRDLCRGCNMRKPVGDAS